MADIFLSHSSADIDAADQIRSWLERDRESWSVFLDKHSRGGILAGQGWQDRLRRELQSCRLVLAIITKDWLASRWCFTEAVTATFRGKDFVGVLPGPLPDDALDVAPPIVHERQRQPLDLATGAGWKDLLHALDRSGLDPSQWFAIPEGVRPYPGFVAFEEKDAGVFFGRDQEITQYLDELNLLKATDRAQALVISGGSGSGKSSLLKAGLIPRLRRQPDWLIVPPFDPSREPVHALFAALRSAAQGIGADVDLPRKPPPTVDELAELLNDSLRAIEEKANAWVLLPLDQAEVLLAGSQSEGETEASRLLAAVGRLLAGRARKVVAVVTIRTEFMPALERALPPAVRLHDRSLRPLTALSEIIEKPAARFGIELEEGLTGRMVEDTRGADAVPLLAYTLRELYETYGDDKLLTAAEYEQLGGVEGAIEKKLHEALSDPEPTAQELAAFRRCFVRQLVRVDETAIEGERYLRTAVAREALPQEAMRLVDRLREARLLVGGDDGTIGIAHDRLIRNWADAPLQTWLVDDSGDRKLIDTLKSFLAAHRDGGPLVSEKPLLDAKDFLERDRSLKDDEPELAQFIEDSIKAEHARLRRQKWFLGGAIAAAFVFLAVAIGAIWFYSEAKKQTEIAERRAVEAETALAWSLLEFPDGEISGNDALGLWRIATTSPAGKHQSHAYLREDSHFAEVYAKRPLEMIRALSLAPEEDVTQTLVRLLASQKPLVRGRTAQALGTLGATDQAAGVAGLLTDDSADVRQAAVSVLQTLGAADQVPGIAARLNDEDSGVREAAIAALETLGAADQAPTIAELLSDNDPDVRRAAVKTLASLGAIGQLAAIGGLLTDVDHNVRQAAVEALTTFGATQEAPAIAARLADEAHNVRKAAVEALGTLGATDQAAAIAKLLADDDASIRQSAIEALGALGVADQATATAATLADAIAARLADQSYNARQAAVEALATLGATDQAAAIAAHLAEDNAQLGEAKVQALETPGAIYEAEAVAASFGDDTGPARRAAVEALGPLSATDQAAAIAKLLANADPYVRRIAVEALGTLGATDQAAAIAELLTDDAWEVRQAATTALGTLGATDQVIAIAGIVGDDDWRVSAAAVEALETLGATDQEAVAKLLANADPYVRQAAIEVLGRLGATDQITAMVPLLLDSSSWVRGAAVEALGLLGATDQAAAIGKFLTDESGLRAAAVVALGRLGATDQAAAIAELLGDEDGRVSGAAVEALVRLAATDQAAAIAGLLADEDATVRRAALNALGTLGATNQVAAVAKRLADEDNWTRGAAIETLGKLRATGQAVAIAAHLADGNLHVRRAAVEALAALGATDQAAAIVELLTLEDEDDYADVRAAAVEALKTLASVDGTDDLASDLGAASRRQLLAVPANADFVAAAVAGVSSSMESRQAVAEIVETLKHPVLGGADATRILLAGLKARFPEAPGPDRGLYPNLAWIEAEFPDIDLRSPPKDYQAAPLTLIQRE